MRLGSLGCSAAAGTDKQVNHRNVVRLRTLLLLAFLLIASLVGVVGYVVVQTNERVLAEAERLQSEALAASEAASLMTQSLHYSQETAHAMVAARYRTLASPTAWPVGEADHEWQPDPATEALIGELQAAVRTLRSELAAAREVSLLAESADDVGALLGKLEDALESYDALVTRFIHLARYHPTEEVNDYLSSQLEDNYRSSLLPAVTDYARFAQDGLDQELTLMRQVFSAARRRNFIFTAAALAGAVLLGLVISRSISRPLDQLQAALRRLGGGQLDTRVNLRTRTEIGTLADAFNQMAAALEASTISRTYLDDVIQSMNEMLFVTDAEGRVETVNRAALEALGYRREEIVGRPMSLLFAQADPEDTLSAGGEVTLQGTRRLMKREGDTVLVSVSSADLGRSEPGATLYLAQDITEQKAAERRLKASLEEKDVLLKEVHHRVKNNLQVISSLLSLQSAETSSGDVHRAFRDSQSRIRSMALIHEHLYQSDDLAHIRFRPYVERLVDIVRRSYADEPTRHRVRIEVDDTNLPVDAAIAYGMTINELVGNALEHAFPGGESGTIRVRFAAEKDVQRLEVSDNGAGLSARIDPHSTGTLGLKLVREFVAQLKGSVRFDSAAGTRVEVTVPLQEEPSSPDAPEARQRGVA